MPPNDMTEALIPEALRLAMKSGLRRIVIRQFDAIDGYRIVTGDEVRDDDRVHAVCWPDGGVDRLPGVRSGDYPTYAEMAARLKARQGE